MKKIFILLVIVSLFSCNKKELELVKTPRNIIEYKITCPNCRVIYKDKDGVLITKYGVSTSISTFNYSFRAPHGFPLYLFIEKKTLTPYYGDIKATILLDGKIFKETKSSYPDSTALAEGNAP